MDDAQLAAALRSAGISHFLTGLLVEDRDTAGGRWRIEQEIHPAWGEATR